MSPGVLHVGHAFNNTLQDILIRWHRMRGFDTLWQPGQDHAGIATQMQVEENAGPRLATSPRYEARRLLAKVWEWKGQYGGTIVEQLQTLGAPATGTATPLPWPAQPGDRGRAMKNSPNFHDAVIKVFVDMYEKGFIYRGKRLVQLGSAF